MAGMDEKPSSLQETEIDVTSGPFKCSYCKKKFETKRELVHHKYNHQSNSKYSCQVCSKVFTSHDGLSRHSRVHQRGKKPVKCKLCKESFSIKLDLEEHHRDCHLEQKAFRCKVCGAEFSWEENLQKHQRMHMVDNYKCQYCDRVFCDTISLKIHQRHHKPVTKPPSPDCKPFSCSICAMRFQFDFSYKAHMNCHKVQGVSQSDSENRTDEVLAHSTVDSSCKTLIAEFSVPDMKRGSNKVSVEICENAENSQGTTVRLKPEDEDDIFDQTAHMNKIPANKASLKVHKDMPYRSANNETSSYIKNSFVSNKNNNEKTDEGEDPSIIDEEMIESKDGDNKTATNGKKKKGYNGRYGELTMTEAKAYQCSFCMKSFRWEVSLQVHVEQHKTGALKANGKATRKVKKLTKVFQKKNSPLKSQLVKRRAGSDDEEDDYGENSAQVHQPANKKRAVPKSCTTTADLPKGPVSTVVHLKKVPEVMNEENVTYVKNSSDIVCITPLQRPVQVFEGPGAEEVVSSGGEEGGGCLDNSLQVVSVNLKRQGEDVKSEGEEGSDTTEDCSQLYISMEPSTHRPGEVTSLYRENQPSAAHRSNVTTLYREEQAQTHNVSHQATHIPPIVSDYIKVDEAVLAETGGSLISQAQPFMDQEIVSIQPVITVTSNAGHVSVETYPQNNGQHNLLHSQHMELPITAEASENHNQGAGKNDGEGSVSFKPITSISCIPQPPVKSIAEVKMSQLEKILMSGNSVASVDSLSTLASTDPGMNQQFIFSTLSMQSTPDSSGISTLSTTPAVSESCVTQQKGHQVAPNGHLTLHGNSTTAENGIVQGSSGSLLSYMQSDSTELLQGMASFMDATGVTQNLTHQAHYQPGEMSSIQFTSGATESPVVTPVLHPVITSTTLAEGRQTYPKGAESKLPISTPDQQHCPGSQFINQLSAPITASQYLPHDSHSTSFAGIPNVQAIQKMVQRLPEVSNDRHLNQNAKQIRKERNEQITQSITQNTVNHQGQFIVANPDTCQITQVSQSNTMLAPNQVSSGNVMSNMQIGLQNNNILSTIPIQNPQNTLQNVQHTQMLGSLPNDANSISAGHVHANSVVNVGVPSQEPAGNASSVPAQMLGNTAIMHQPIAVPAAINTQQQIISNAGAKNVLPTVQGRAVVLNNLQTMQNIVPNCVPANLPDKTQTVLNNLQLVNKNATSQADNVVNTNISNVAIIQGNVQPVPQNPVIFPSLQNNLQYVQPAIQQGIMPVQTVGLGNPSEIRILGNVPNVFGTVHLQTGYVPQQVSCINEFGQVLAVTPLFQIPVDQNNLHQPVGGTFIQQTQGPIVQGQQQILAQPMLGQQVVQNGQVSSSLPHWQGSGVNMSQHCPPPNVVNVVTGSGIGPSVQNMVCIDG